MPRLIAFLIRCAGWEGDAARCAAAVAARAAPPVTIHEPMYCRAAGEASRPTTTVATLRPLRNWETLRAVLIRLRVVCDAELSAFDEQRRSNMQSTIAATASVPNNTVELRFGAASMVIDATITVTSVPAAALVYEALAPSVESASAASAWLFPGGESAVLGVPLLTAEYGQIEVAPEELPVSVAAVLALMVLLAVAFLSWFIVTLRRRKRTKSVDGDDGAWTAPPSTTRKYAPYQIVPVASDGSPLDLPLGHDLEQTLSDQKIHFRGGWNRPCGALGLGRRGYGHRRGAGGGAHGRRLGHLPRGRAKGHCCGGGGWGHRLRGADWQHERQDA